jgi:hypothetical protein
MKTQTTSLRLCAVAIAVLSLLLSFSNAVEPPDFTPLVGKWQVTYPKNGVRAYEITNAKSILSDDGKAKMHAALTLAPDGCYEFTFQNKNFYRLRLSGDPSSSITTWRRSCSRRGCRRRSRGTG